MVQGGGVVSEHLLDSLRIEALQDVADGCMGGSALPVQAEGSIQSTTVHLDEGLDGAEGIAAGDHSKDGEQQKIRQLVEFAFSPARVRNLAECCKELIERSHGRYKCRNAEVAQAGHVGEAAPYQRCSRAPRRKKSSAIDIVGVFRCKKDTAISRA